MSLRSCTTESSIGSHSPRHSTTATLTLAKPEWLTILALSTRWHFLEFRELAISHLAPQVSDPVEMVTVGRREYVARWVEEGYEKLVLKKEAISEEEGEQIGWKATVILYIIRHELEGKLKLDVVGAKKEGGGCDGDSSRGALSRAMIRERFRDEMCLVASEEYSRRTRSEQKQEAAAARRAGGQN